MVEDARHRRKRDVAGQVLKVLDTNGPLPLPDLLERTDALLLPLLRALKDLRDFRLIEIADADQTVRLSDSGTRAATVLKKKGIRDEASRLLEE